MPVHVLTSHPIPKYVHVYLSEGSKFVPDRRKLTSVEVCNQFHNFVRKVALTEYFGASRKPKLSASKPGQPRFQPPVTPELVLYSKLTLEDLCYYEPSACKGNQDWLTAAAKKWLHEHREHVMVISADKNLGDCIIDRSIVEKFCVSELLKVALPVPNNIYFHHMADGKCILDDLSSTAVFDGTLKPRERYYLLKQMKHDSAGNFRINVKIHKPSLSARPIMNLGTAWTAPLSLFLSNCLLPLVQHVPTVVISGFDFKQKIENCNIPAGHVIVTMDVVNLYPSICIKHLIAVIGRRIRSYFVAKWSFGTLLMNLLELLLSQQFVQYKGQVWQISKGLCTGLSCATVLANLYLAECDAAVCGRFCSSTLMFFYRYIDDAIFCVKNTSLEAVQKEMEEWHSHIKWELTGNTSESRSVSFLDAEIICEGSGRCSFQLYRKAMNVYQYLARNSCHPEHCFHSLLYSETVRTVRMFTNPKLVHKALHFLVRKVQLRGYCLHQAWRDIFHVLKKMRFPQTVQSKLPKHVFVLPFSFSLNAKYVRKSLHKHAHLLKASKVLMAHTVQPNRFRIHYFDNWLLNS